MKIKVDYNQLNQTLQAPNKVLEEAAYNEVKNNLDQATDMMLQEFNEHPVTQEIEAGPTASNSSGSLGGYGNLFSFLGFENGTNPIAFLRNFLKESVSIVRRPSSKARGRYTFNVTVPEIKEIENETPLPYESSRSWVRGIERGISGIAYYIFTKKSKSSRSGTGLQSQGKARGGVRFQNQSYLTSILNKFYKNAKVKK